MRSRRLVRPALTALPKPKTTILPTSKLRYVLLLLLDELDELLLLLELLEDELLLLDEEDDDEDDELDVSSIAMM